MRRRTKIYSVMTLVSVGAILAGLALRHVASPGQPPATSISNGEDSAAENPESPALTHQPTILKADAALAPPVGEPPEASRAPSNFRGYVTDENTPTLREASPTDFLPIPSLDAPERQ